VGIVFDSKLNYTEHIQNKTSASGRCTPAIWALGETACLYLEPCKSCKALKVSERPKIVRGLLPCAIHFRQLFIGATFALQIVCVYLEQFKSYNSLKEQLPQLLRKVKPNTISQHCRPLHSLHLCRCFITVSWPAYRVVGQDGGLAGRVFTRLRCLYLLVL